MSKQETASTVCAVYLAIQLFILSWKGVIVFGFLDRSHHRTKTTKFSLTNWKS